MKLRDISSKKIIYTCVQLISCGAAASRISVLKSVSLTAWLTDKHGNEAARNGRVENTTGEDLPAQTRYSTTTFGCEHQLSLRLEACVISAASAARTFHIGNPLARKSLRVAKSIKTFSHVSLRADKRRTL